MDFSAVLATQTAQTATVETSAKISPKSKTSADSSYGSVMEQYMKPNEQNTLKDNQGLESEKVDAAISNLVTDVKEILEDADKLTALSELPVLTEGKVDLSQLTQFGDFTHLDEEGLENLSELIDVLEHLGLSLQDIAFNQEGLAQSQVSDAFIEKINTIVLDLMANLQNMFNQAALQSGQSNMSAEDVWAQLMPQLSKEQINDLSKVLGQLQNFLAQQKDLSKLDAEVLSLLNRLNTFKEQTINQPQTNLMQSGQSKDRVISFMQTAQSDLNGENANTQGEQAKQSQAESTAQKQKPFLLRTDMTKVLWQSEMSKVQQLSMNVEMKGSQVNTESFMKSLDKILSGSAFLKNGAMSKLVIKLNPESLGTIRIELIQSQTSLIAKLHVQNEQVKSLIESQLAGLKQSFSAQNVQVDRFEISSNIDFDKYQRQFQQGSFRQSGNSQEDSAERNEENQTNEDVSFKSSLEEIQKTLEEELI